MHEPGAPSNIKQLIHDLLNKKYRLSFLPERVIYMNNGIEYYYVEAEGTDGSRFIINAFGLEAEDLFEEVHRCIICGRSIFRKNENANLIRYQAGENTNLFVEANCINLLKKLEIAYGKEFFIR
jgi:hypothetical protein